MGALLIHRGVSEACKQTALEVYLIMSHEETLAAFIGSEGVGNGREEGRGAFPISRQTHRYRQPKPPTQLRVTWNHTDPPPPEPQRQAEQEAETQGK